MKTALCLTILLFPALVQAAETLYKCKNASGDAVYSEYPCSSKHSKKVILKDNTLDHSEMRNSKLYKQPSSSQAGDQSGSSVTSMPEIKGAGFQEFPPSNTGSSYTNFR